MHTFLPEIDNCLFLNQLKEENESRNDFMNNLHESNVTGLEFELITLGPAVSTMEIGLPNI